MTESRLQRWSRKKAEASKQSGPTTPLPVENEPPAEEQELAINQALPEHEVLEKYGLPDPDTITLGTDITGFMRKEIPELLRRKALRALWKSNPVLAVLDGLNDYDEDYTDAATAGEAVKTLYKVGQGMFDKTATKTESTIEHAEPQTGEPEPVNTRETSPPEGSSEPEPAIDSSSQTRQPPSLSDAEDEEAEPAPRYRPRMRFD